MASRDQAQPGLQLRFEGKLHARLLDVAHGDLLYRPPAAVQRGEPTRAVGGWRDAADVGHGVVAIVDCRGVKQREIAIGHKKTHIVACATILNQPNTNVNKK